MTLARKLRSRLGDLWWYSAIIFVACRSGDLIQAFIGLWLVPKFVPQEELGAALPLLQAGSVFGLPLSILVVPFSRWLTLYAARGERGKIKRLLSIAFAGTAAAFGIAAIAARFILPLFFERLSVAAGSLGLLIVCAGLVGPFSSVFGSALQGLKRYGAIAAIAAASAPLRLAVMLVAMPFRALSGYVLGQISAPALNIVCSLAALRRDIGRDIHATPLGRDDVRAMFRYAVPFAAYMAAGTLLGAWQSLLFRQRLPEVESAAFYIISRFGEISTYFAMAMGAVLFPMAVEAAARGAGAARLLARSLAGALATGLVATLCLWAFGGPLLGLVPLWRPYAPYAGLMAAFSLRMTLCAANGAFCSFETASGHFSFLRYWLPLTAVETGALVAFTGYGAFRGILPDASVDWMRGLGAARLSFFIRWLLALTTLQSLAIAAHLAIRHFRHHTPAGTAHP